MAASEPDLGAAARAAGAAALQIIESLEHLMLHLRRPLLVICDRLPGHRSADVRDFFAAQRSRLTLEWLPGYAPDRRGVLRVVKGRLRAAR